MPKLAGVVLHVFAVVILLDHVSPKDIYVASFNSTDLSLEVKQESILGLFLNASVSHDLQLEFTYWDAAGNPFPREKLNSTAIELLDPIIIKANQTPTVNVTIKAVRPGQVSLGLNITKGRIVITNLPDLACHVAVMHHKWLDILQYIIGWGYFAAWTISFYPQIILNWRRKSVIGLNFDFVILNIIGFLVYSIFNVGLFWIKPIQELYRQQHPFGTIPVMANDVFFALHAFVISLFMVVQILCYKRGGQRVSRVCIGILIIIGVYCIIICSITGATVINWLDCLYYLSYVKLFITFIKYTPQAVMNCRRRSTVGWSIMNIILDMTGGILSIVQMFILAYNFNDWSSVTGSPIKFGLGIFSLGFDIFFMIQHWCLYPDHRENVILIPEDLHVQSSYILDNSQVDATEPTDPDLQNTGPVRHGVSDTLQHKPH